MKTLSEEINEVMAAKSSVASKKVALIKLGLCNSDVNALFFNYNRDARILARESRRLRLEQESIIGSLTFGVEIECYNAARDRIIERADANGLNISYESYNHIDNAHYYKFVSDGSICGDMPIECVSPVLKGKEGFSSLKKCCKTLNEVGCMVNRSTGLHVHVGGVTNAKHYINVFKNYQKLERVIDTFMAESRRGNSAYYSQSLLDHNFNTCETIDDVRDIIRRKDVGLSRYHKVNAEAYGRHHTIEFRQHAGTTNYEKISMWASFCIRLVVWSKDNVLTDYVNSINEIPFLTDKEKTYFTKRANELAVVA